MGGGTYYAQVIYQAQADLAAQQAANPGSRNAMIILTVFQTDQTEGLEGDTGWSALTSQTNAFSRK